MNTTTGRINPQLDIAALAAEFKRNGKISISNVLTEDFADKTFNCLDTEVPWRLMYYNHQGKGQEVVGRIYPHQWEAMPEQEKRSLLDRIQKEAGKNFHYLYNSYDVLDARRKGQDPELFLQTFLDFMGSDEYFNFIRAISGDQVFNRVDCHAARYMPGHFLKEHVDASPFEDRHMAYVFYFTPEWNADFGGLTHFLDDEHQVTDTYIPGYNSLTLFRVPVPHSVSAVTAFAPNPRYSITGWFTHYK